MRFHGSANYISTDDLTLAVNAAVTLQRPLLIKGEPGTGKTMLAEEVAKALGLPIFEWHIKSTTKAQQACMNTTPCRAARFAVGRPAVQTSATTSSRALVQAFTADEPVVLLIDEVDKATSSSQRPAARARPHGVLRLRDA